MRHDTTPVEMALGFGRVLWENQCFWAGVVRLCRVRKDKDGADTGLLYTELDNFGRFAVRYNRTTGQRLADLAKAKGWGDLPQLERDLKAPPARARWRGFTGDGACKPCLTAPWKKWGGLNRKPSKPLMDHLWHDMVISHAYGLFYQSQIDSLAPFDNEDGDLLSRHMADAFGAVRFGLDCFGDPAELYDKKLCRGDRDASNWRDLLAKRRRGLPPITDMALDRDWCPTCRSNMVEINDRPFPDPA